MSALDAQSYTKRGEVMKKYFLYDPEGEGFALYETEVRRDEIAKAAIDACCDEGWSECVDQICVGVVTHAATKVNERKRPPEEELDEDGCDAEGDYWDQDFSHICDYKLLPLKEMK